MSSQEQESPQQKNATPDPSIPDQGGALEQGEQSSIAETLDATVSSPQGLIEPYTPQKPHHEDVSRRCIAYWLLAILSFVVAFSFFMIIWLKAAGIDVTFKDFRSMLELIITPLLTLVSAATGFYFASQRKS